MSRVYSVRLSNKTLYGCYKLLAGVGTPTKDLPTGTVISTAISATIEALMKAGRLPEVDEDFASKAISEVLTVKTYKVPDMNGVVDSIVTELEAVKIIAPPSEIQRETVQKALENVQAEEERELVAGVTKEDVFRVSPNVEPPKQTKAPWELSPMVPVELVKDDIIYINAPNEMFAMAVRATYLHLNPKKWGTEDAAKLVVSTYKIFAEYKERQEKV